MKVLIACEESQTICCAYRQYGVEAYSNDLQSCSGGHPEWHLQMDCREAVVICNWDLIIAHPPCTYFTVAGNRYYNDPGRVEKRKEALSLFEFFYYLPGRVAIENPVPIKAALPYAYDQIVDPADFNEEWHKRTCLWLHNIPPLMATCINPFAKSFMDYFSKGGKDRQKKRCKTSPALAAAIANQWRF